MKDKYTHISVVIDRSGSMQSMAKDVIGGFNNLVDEQIKVDGEATMTVVRFDTEYETISDFSPISGVIRLDSTNFQPRGGTALLDAMGKTMNDVRARINEMTDDEKPFKAIFVFITDGEENQSREYNKERVFEMISDLRNENGENKTAWDFVFIGANQDAIQSGGSLGIRAGASLTYAANGDGARSAFQSLSSNLTTYRCACKSKEYSFSDSDRKEQEKFDNCIPTHLSDLSNRTTADDKNKV